MELVKSKGSWLGLLLVISVSFFSGLVAMDHGDDSGSTGDESAEKREWTEEEQELSRKLFLNIAQGNRDQVAALLDQNPELVNYLRSDESTQAAARALVPPRNEEFESFTVRDTSLPLLRALGGDADHLAMMTLLLDRGADLYVPGSTHHVPVFFEAIRYYRPQEVPAIIKLLVERDEEIVNRPGRFGQTPSEFAIMHARDTNGTIELLVSLGANINAQDKDGWTALHYALYRGGIFVEDTIRLLLSLGADPGITANDGRTADMVALDSPHYLGQEYAACAAAIVAEARASLLSRIGSGITALARGFGWIS